MSDGTAYVREKAARPVKTAVRGAHRCIRAATVLPVVLVMACGIGSGEAGSTGASDASTPRPPLMSQLFEGCGRGIDGTFWCFQPPPESAVPVPALDGVLDTSVGGALLSGFLNSEPSDFDCEVMSNHQPACEGSDENGQLGFATSSAQTCQYDCTPILQQQRQSCPYPCENKPRIVPGVGPSTAVIGNGGPCALGTDGSVSCWGSDASGNIVAPHIIALPDKAVGIGGGDHQSSSAVLANGQLACWLLAPDGPIDTSHCPSTGCALPAVVPGLSNLVALSITWDHGCVLRNDGAAFCWGGSLAGLDDGTGMTSVTPVRVATSLVFSQIASDLGLTCGLTPDRHVACWGITDAPPGVNGASACPGGGSSIGCRLVPLEIPGVGNVKQVSASFAGPFAYALLENGTVLSIDDAPKGGFVVKQVAP